MRIGRVAASLALVALAGCGTPDAPDAETSPSAAPSQPSAARLTDARCADLVVLGLRGQGQSAKTNEGMGREVLLTARALVPRLPDGTTVRLAAVRHPGRLSPTLASYDADIATGVRMVQRRLASLAAACPRSRVALIGFSQGSQILHRALTGVRAQSSTDFSRVALVVLIGDPLRDPAPDADTGLRTVEFGTRLDGQGSNGPGAGFPAAIRPHVVEACVAGDNVCNAPLTGRRGGVSDTHRTYYERNDAVRRLTDVAAATLR